METSIMAILMNDIKQYISDIGKPTSPDKLAEWSVPAGYLPRIEVSDTLYPTAAVSRLIDALLAANIAPDPIEDRGEEVLEEMDFRMENDILAEAAAQLVERMQADEEAEVLTIERHPVRWVKQASITEMTESLAQIAVSKGDTGAALVAVMKRLAEQISLSLDDENAVEYTRFSNMLEWVMRTIVEMASAEVRAADAARRFSKPLQYIVSNTDDADLKFDAHSLRADIRLECTIPIAEAECPSWVDPYTGDYDEWEFLRVSNANVEKGDDVVDDGFNEEDGLTIETFEEDMRGSENPVWQQVETDLRQSQNYYILREELEGRTGALRGLIDETIADAPRKIARRIAKLDGENYTADEYMNAVWFRLNSKQRKAMLSKYPPHAGAEERRILKAKKGIAIGQKYDAEIRSMIRMMNSDIQHTVLYSLEAQKYLAALQDAANTHYPVDIFLEFVQFNHAFCFPDEEVETEYFAPPGVAYGIEFPKEWHNAGWVTLGDLIENDGDEILARRHDYVGEQTTSLSDIENFCADLPRLEEAVCDPKTQEVTKHPAYVRRFLEVVNQGGSIEAAISAGWDEWRSVKSPRGQAEYLKALKKGKTPEQARKVFWAIWYQEHQIASIRKEGLVMKGGSVIEWRKATEIVKADPKDLCLHETEDRIRLKELIRKNITKLDPGPAMVFTLSL